MTEDQTLMKYYGRPLADVPVEIREKIEADPDLLSSFETQCQISRLVALKRYETPDPALEDRLCHRVGIRIRNQPSPVKEPFWAHWVLPEWARMVAVVVIMLGLSVLVHREMLINDAMEEELGGLQTSETGVDLPMAGTPDADPMRSVQFSELRHEDAFTTRLPGFSLSLDAFDFPNFPRVESPEPTGVMATSTNQWSAPLTLPVMNPAP